MSAPSSGPPKTATYCIDPRKQCGVVKPSGNPCTALLSCKIHGEDEKRTAKRFKKQQKLLKRQLALDASPFAHHAGQLRLAPVFDANIHCGVDLPAGEPCTQDLLLCETHTCEQQSAVQGRSAGLDDLLRVYRANASRPTWKSGEARGKLHEAKLQICRGWEQACQDQASQHRLEMQLFQDQGRHDRQKAQLYDQDMENRVAAQLLWDRDQEYRRSTQLRYDQDRAELDRRVHERQAIEDEVTRLRTRARHADQLEQARNRQQSEKEFLMHYIKG
jgi:hypothetical protein